MNDTIEPGLEGSTGLVLVVREPCVEEFNVTISLFERATMMCDSLPALVPVVDLESCRRCSDVDWRANCVGPWGNIEPKPGSSTQAANWRAAMSGMSVDVAGESVKATLELDLGLSCSVDIGRSMGNEHRRLGT